MSELGFAGCCLNLDSQDLWIRLVGKVHGAENIKFCKEYGHDANKFSRFAPCTLPSAHSSLSAFTGFSLADFNVW
jgi:hypothetical protein